MTDQRATRRTENIGTGFIVVATAVGALEVLAFQALASRSLGTDAFAPIAVLWTLTFLVYTVLQLPAEQHLTRALVVTRRGSDIDRVRRDMLAAFGLAFVIGVGFVLITLDRFFEGDGRFVVVAAGIMVSRSIMATARGTVAGHRRFAAYGATIALEGGALVLGGIAAAMLGASALGFTVVMALAPFASLAARPFSPVEGTAELPEMDAQPGSFLAWLIVATAASQLIIAGGPIAVSFIGGTAAAVSIFFTSFARLRGPGTSAYNLVARVLPDFTALAHGDDPRALWAWGPRITVAAAGVAVLGALGSGLLLRPLIEVVYGADFVPPRLAAILGGLGVGLGLGALFATQIYSATAKGRILAAGWLVGLLASVLVLVLSSLDPIDRTALAFAVGEGVGLGVLGLGVPLIVLRSRH
jgi:O-antigen/teichoic acid export membrane protein